MATIIKASIAILVLLWALGAAALLWSGPVDAEMAPTLRLAGTWTTVCIAAASAIVGLNQFYVSERWKRAEAARDMLDKMLDDPGAITAFNMIDQEEGEVFESGSESFSISLDDIRTGLSEWHRKDGLYRFIRRNFQTLGFYLARLNMFLDKGNVDEDRIVPFFTSHSQPLAALEPHLSEFYNRLGYFGAAKFLTRVTRINQQSIDAQ